MEFAERAVVDRHGALALQHVDFHGGLAVARRRENLALARGDRRVRGNHLRHHAAKRFDAERERRYVQQQHVLHVAGKHAALYGCTDRDDFVRVHAFVRLPAEKLAHQIDGTARDARGAADEDDLVDVFREASFASSSALRHRTRSCAGTSLRNSARTPRASYFICKCFEHIGGGG